MKKKRLFSFIVIIIMICAATILGGWTALAKPTANDVNLEDLMAKWKASDNWVFVQNQKFSGYNEIDKSSKEWTEITIIERNGNITSRIKQIENGTKTLKVNVFDKDGYTNYYGRMSGTVNWDWSCREPNPTKCKGKIEDLFLIEPYLEIFEETIKNTETLLREERGVYYFKGSLNMTEILRSRNLQLDESFPQLWKAFTCSLTFGTSKAQKPLMP